jgi:hypothetical protein
MTRGTGKRFGTLFFSNDGTTGANFIETATQTGSNIGVTISASNANVITYTTTSTGSPAIVKYNINYFS